MGTGGSGVSYEEGIFAAADDRSAGLVKSLSELEETDPRLFPSAEMKFTSPLSSSKTFPFSSSHKTVSAKAEKKMKDNMKKKRIEILFMNGVDLLSSVNQTDYMITH